MKISKIINKLNLSKYHWFQTFLKQKYAHSVIIGLVIFCVDLFLNLVHSNILQAFIIGSIACLLSAFFIFNPLKNN
jgi:uncharacterized MnhB-related membrane protein